MKKIGMLIFMFKEVFELFGVKILIISLEECFKCSVGLCLFVFEGNKMIS